MKLNGTNQLLVNADNANILEGSKRSIKKTESIVVVSKQIGIQLKDDNIKYMVMS
jgi:hypothetical protein